MIRLICSSLLAFLSFKGYSQEVNHNNIWRTDIALGEFVLTTYITAKQNGSKISIKSPRNADKRVIGSTKSILGRAFNKLPKKGSFFAIEGITHGDSITGTAVMPVLGRVQFRGILDEKQNLLSGELIKKDAVIGTLNGHKSAQSRNNYTDFYPKIINLAQEHIYSREVLESTEWKDFTKKLKKLTVDAHDDIELFLGFNIYSQKLPFSHFNLVFQQESIDNDTSAITMSDSSVVFEEKSPGIAYVKIKNFSSSQQEIASLFPGIISKNYEHLILDFRNNSGGGLEAALELARFVLKDSVVIGYFATNKFPYPERSVSVLKQLPVTTATTTVALIDELNASEGRKLTAPKPKNPIYQGKLYILTDNKTASTCEPIVYVLKNKQNAIVVGQTTAGAMLSAAYFDIEGKYKLVLPVADFYTYDGKRLEKNGVVPSTSIPNTDDALERTLLILNKEQ